MEEHPQANDLQKLGKDTNHDVSMIDLDHQVHDKPLLQDMEPKEKHTLLEELQRTQTADSNSSGSDEEVEEGGEGKKRKKKGLKDKIREKMSREDHHQDPANIAPENAEEEKKGFLDKLMEKLPGGQLHHEKTGEGGLTVETTANNHHPKDSSPGEKKGILDKIKEKLPGGHHKNEDHPEVKEKVN